MLFRGAGSVYALVLGSVAGAAGCLSGAGCSTSSATAAPDNGRLVAADMGSDAGADPLEGCTKDPGPPVTGLPIDPSADSDPTGGASKFTLAQAMAGFPAGSGKLSAGIRTEKSSIRCELFETSAPVSVANFVGLARGTRPFKDATGKWRARPFYDGLTWHRVIPNFVIQGGDPEGTGMGGPGYDLIKENQVDEPLGTLAMAASTTVSGSQFYIVVGKGPASDYNVFGACTTETAVAIASVARDRNDAPTLAVHMMSVRIGRCP